MDDEIGVAPDRRGEMAVGGAREPGVAEVVRVVARLLERAQDERREGLPPDAPTARRIARCAVRSRLRGRQPARARSSRAPTASGCRGRSASRAGAGSPAGRDARGRGRAPRGPGPRGTPQRARWRGSSTPRRACARAARSRARRSRRGPPQRRTRSRSRDLERRARSAPPGAPSRPRLRDRAAPGSPAPPRGAPPGRRWPRIRVDHRAVEARLAVGRHLHGHAEPVEARPERAGIVGEVGRQHRRHEPRDVRRERAVRGAAVERRAGADEIRHVGDVHPGADPVGLAPEAERVVEILGAVGIDRDRRQLAQVDTPVEARLGRLVALEVDSRAALDEERLEDVLDPLREPMRLTTCARPRPGRTTARSPRPRSPAPLGSSMIGTPGVKNGSPESSLPRRSISTTTNGLRGASTPRGYGLGAPLRGAIAPRRERTGRAWRCRCQAPDR